MQEVEQRSWQKDLRPWHGAAVLAVALFLWRLVGHWGALIDDAYISLRYGRHWAEGLGLVFNVGERVEGYTNFLWVILGGLLLKTPVPPILGLRLVSLLACCVAMLVGIRLLRRFDGVWGTNGAGQTTSERPWLDGPTTALIVVLSSAESLTYYASTAMESMLFAALYMAALYCALVEAGDFEEEAQRRVSVWLFLLLALTRPEGVLLFVITHGLLVTAGAWHRLGPPTAGAWHRLAGKALWPDLKRSLVDGVVFAGVYGPYFAWRWSYYGEFFPNTYYAKVTGGPEQWRNGLLALGDWSLSHPLWVAVLLCVPWVLWSRRGHRDTPKAFLLWGSSLLWLGYVVRIGGDFMPFFRFFLPLLAPLAVLTVWLWRQAPWPLSQGPRSLWLGLLVLLQLLAGWANEEALRAYVAHRTTVVGLQVGRFFGQRLQPDDLVATNTVGSLPYESGLPSLDMLGLTDKAIARHPIYVVSPRWSGHRRGWGDYVVRRRPRVVLWYNSAGAADPHYLGDHQLADNPFFRFFYQARVETLPPTGDDAEVAHFPGAPFGGRGQGVQWLGELGAEIEVREILGRPWTTARSAAIRLHYFERRPDRDAMWDWTTEGDLDLFLRRVVDHWRRRQPREAGPAGQRQDAAARLRVEALCHQALLAIERQDRSAAKVLLERAVAANSKARSPLPFQYITNLAFLEGQLFLAIHSQQEALRLEPENELFAANLKALLTQPFADYRAAVSSATALPVSDASSEATAGSVGAVDAGVPGRAPKQPASRQ